MSDRFSMSPEVRELLGELAGDDSAELLRVGLHQAEREAGELRPHVSSSAPFLAQAERRLLEVHREEAAQLLYLYAAWIREENPTYRAHTHYKDAQPLPPRNELDARARHLSSETSLSASDAEAARLLRACLSRGRGTTPAAALAAALRLAPSHSIRIFQGLCCYFEQRDVRGAEELLLRVLRETPSPRLASYARENLGMIAAQDGDYARAAREYGEAVRSDDSRALPKLSWLNFSLLAANYNDACRAAELVDSTLEPGDNLVDWYLNLYSLGNRSETTAESQRVRRQVEEKFGPTARRVFDVFN